MARRKWHRVRYAHYYLEGRNRPEPDAWSVWKDSKGHIEVARFKLDGIDHFYPPTKYIKEEDIIAWRELRCQRKTTVNGGEDHWNYDWRKNKCL